MGKPHKPANRRPGSTDRDCHNPALQVVGPPHLHSGLSEAADGDGAYRRNSVVADSPGSGVWSVVYA